jgi:hypothetical protein
MLSENSSSIVWALKKATLPLIQSAEKSCHFFPKIFGWPGGSCGEPALRGKRRCRTYGGPGSGAPKGDQNARRDGLFTSDAIAGRKQIQDLLGDARKLLKAMK